MKYEGCVLIEIGKVKPLDIIPSGLNIAHKPPSVVNGNGVHFTMQTNADLTSIFPFKADQFSGQNKIKTIDFLKNYI